VFPRVVTVKKGDQTYRYLKIVQCHRQDGRIKQRVVGNLGNIDRYSDEELRRLIAKLRSFLKNPGFGTLDDLETGESKQFGIPYAVGILWERLGLDRAIAVALRDKELAVDVSLCVKAMVVARLCDPQSKRATHEWLDRLYLPELEGGVPPLHHFYRALDHLVEAKEDLERHIYHRLTDLLSLRLNLVFYDVTSSYFEGTRCALGRYGYSRDQRPDCRQITVGLLVTPEGLPIAHDVFPGNTLDGETVDGVLQTLRQRFEIAHVIFVGDRGMVSRETLKRLAEAGYSYVIGYHKRGRVLSDALLAEHQDLSTYQRGEGGLLYKEVRLPALEGADEGARMILCHNEEKAVEDRAFREAALLEAEEELGALQARLAAAGQPRRGRKLTPKGAILRLARCLETKGVKRFFAVEYDGGHHLSFRRDEEAIAREALRDGKFLVQTNAAELSSWQAVQAYKTLQRVERAFREIKDFLRLRPVYHWNESRVRGHVFVCVLAYLFEQWLGVLYDRHLQVLLAEARKLPDEEARLRELRRLQGSRLSGRGILDLLSRLQATAQSFVGKPFYAVTSPNPRVAHLLKALDLPHPPRIIPRQ